MHICIAQYADPQALKQQTNGTHTHTHKPSYEQEDVTVLWNQAVHTDKSYSKQARYNN